MNNFYKPNDYLPSDITPFPNLGGNPCIDGCGRLVHIYEANISHDDKGRLRCGECTRRREKRMGKDPRRILRNFFWRHGHDPNDAEATEESPYTYVNLQPTEAPVINQREELHGGPETPFPCQKCGAKLRAAAERSVESIIGPIGYRPSPGTVAPREKVVVLVCPNDSPEHRHPYIQMRESILRSAMARQSDGE